MEDNPVGEKIMTHENTPLKNSITRDDIRDALIDIRYMNAGEALVALNVMDEGSMSNAMKTLTLCLATATNGHVFIGHANCVVPENYNEKLGQQAAFGQVENQLWPILGYNLRSALGQSVPEVSEITPTKIKEVDESAVVAHNSHVLPRAILVEVAARAAHEANNAINRAAKPHMVVHDWDTAPEEMKDSTRKGVLFALDNPDAMPEDQHQAWYDERVQQGWVYGPVKDTEAKTHPCLVKYNQLDVFDRLKDSTFQAVVRSIAAPYN